MIGGLVRFGLVGAAAALVLPLAIAIARAQDVPSPGATHGLITTASIRGLPALRRGQRRKKVPVDAGAAATTAADAGPEPTPEPAPSAVDLDAGAPPSPAPPAPAAPVESPPPEPAPAAALPIGGRVFTYVRVPTAADPVDTPLQQASASVWLELKPRFNEWSSAAATVSVDAVRSSIDPDTTLRARVREAYVDAYKDGWEIRAGQQIIPWGNADIINPTDFLSAKDYSFFAADNEVRRLGALHLWFSLTPASGSSPFQIIVVWTPVLTGSRLLVPQGLLPPGVTNRGIVAPPATLDNLEAAARIAYKGNSWDAAVVGFRGFNHDPEFFLVSQDATSTVIGQTYRHIWGAGLETSLSEGKWVFRLEGAYVSTENARARDTARQPAHVDVVLGVERPFLERFRFQLQGVARYYPSHPDVVRGARSSDPLIAATAQGIANANAILLNYQDPLIPAATLRLSFATENEKLEAEVLGVASFNTHGFARTNFLVRPMLTYHWTDALKFHLGAESFGGPSTTPLGALRPFSGAFVGGEYRF